MTNQKQIEIAFTCGAQSAIDKLPTGELTTYLIDNTRAREDGSIESMRMRFVVLALCRRILDYERAKARLSEQS